MLYMYMHVRMGVRRVFSRGGRAWPEVKNFQGSPLGCVLRSAVRKITKGPPLVQILGRKFLRKYGIFYRERGEPEYFGTELLINNKKHLISQEICMDSIGEILPGLRPAWGPRKVSTKIESLPYKMLFK